MDAMNAMNAMNGRAPDGYPPWRAAPPATAAAPPPSPPDPDDELLAAIAETVREVHALDATIAAADADLARLPTLLAWLVRVRHPVLWLICVPRHEAAAALTAPFPAAAAAPHGRRRMALLPALLLALLALALLALALLAPALLGAAGMAPDAGEAVR